VQEIKWQGTPYHSFFWGILQWLITSILYGCLSWFYLFSLVSLLVIKDDYRPNTWFNRNISFCFWVGFSYGLLSHHRQKTFWQNIGSFMKALFSRSSFFVILFLFSFFAYATDASATLDPAISTAVTGLTTDTQSLFSLMWPYVAMVFAGLLLIRIFKRIGNKA